MLNMRRLLFFLLFVGSLAAGVVFNAAGRYRDVYSSICDLTEDHFYRADSRLEDWVALCRTRAAKLSIFANSDRLLADVLDTMNEMGVSHFQIYSPVEDRQLWKGEAIDTGIRARYVEDHLVVYRVLPDSAGLGAGVRVGDEILKITGTDQVTPWGAQHRSGRFQLRRGERALEVDLASHTMTPDFSPRLIPVNASTAVVEIPSFRSEFFEPAAWTKFARGLGKYSHLILDVRENAGGNFVAMLRALSTFQCGGRSVGVLVQPRKKLPDKASFEDNTDDRYQIDELDRFRSLGLTTFSKYGCFKGKVTVLIAAETSSVAEIFANSFFFRPNSRVWGQPSAGDVVLAVWYDLPALGPGFSVSIPEAVYLSPTKKELEGKGVWPQRELFYDLKQALAGKDNWITEAAR